MNRVALKILLGDRGKYLGIVTGIALATVLMLQQPGILISIFSRTYSFISDIPEADVWVMDPMVQFMDDVKPITDTQLYRVRGVQGVEWAVPLYKGTQKVRLANGETVGSNLLGLDDATLIGGPAVMVQGRLADLRLPDSVIVDQAGATGRLARPAGTPGGKPTPLAVGDVLEINDKRARVVGIARATPTFQSQPIIYTTYSRAKSFALSERKMLAFVLVKAKPGVSREALARQITRETGLGAHTPEEFKAMSLWYMLKNTSILVNFGFVVLVGFGVGAAITGQIFYNFTLDNLRHFGVFKAMGATDGMLRRMILLQAVLAGFVGFGIGVGAVAAFAWVTRSSSGLSMTLNSPLLLACAVAVLLIVLLAAAISVRKIIRLEPAVVFKG